MLLPETEFFDDSAIPLDLVRLEVVEEATASPDEAEKTSAGVVVLFMDLEMLGKVGDPLGKQRDLDLRRTGIRIVKLILTDDLLLG